MKKLRAIELKKKGFTLVEILVVISILSIAGVIILTIFTRILKGNNKAQILAAIKQNGQAVLENMDKTIRGADNVVCISLGKETIVVVQGGVYTRYKFVTPRLPDIANGLIQQDNPVQPETGNNSDINLFKDNVCTDPMGTDAPVINTLTDTDLQSGVSAENGSFNKNPQAGFKDTVTIKFQLTHALNAPAAVAGQIDPVNFETTIQLR